MKLPENLKVREEFSVFITRSAKIIFSEFSPKTKITNERERKKGELVRTTTSFSGGAYD